MIASSALDRLQHARHAAERERGGAERDDLAVVVSRVAPDDLDRIGRRVRLVEARVQPIERRLQSTHAAICNLSLQSIYHSGMRRMLAESARRRSCCSSRSRRRAAATCYLRRSLPAVDGTSRVAGISAPVDIVRDADASRTSSPSTKARRALRSRLRARAGSPVADGIPAPHRPRPAVGGLRRRRRCRRIGFCGRSASAAPRARRGTRCRRGEGRR